MTSAGDMEVQNGLLSLTPFKDVIGRKAISLIRLWNTVRHLRMRQLLGRAQFVLLHPRANLIPSPMRREQKSGAYLGFPLLRPDSLLAPDRFRFLNRSHDALGSGAWNDPACDKLWLYNLHYFDDLNAEGAAQRIDWHRALLVRWVAENPPGIGVGWEPYPTSLRIVNWIKWTLAGNALPPDCLHSLAVQARWLSRRLEYHLLGNHLFANAKALAFAGAFCVGPEAQRWLGLGQRLLARELVEQVLPDGGHFERSPMYHALLLEDVLDLINLAGAYPDTVEPAIQTLCRDKAAAMLDWLAAMCHPDGDIGFFNDAAFGIAPTLRELNDYGRRLGLPSPAEAGRPGARADTVGGEAGAVPGDGGAGWRVNWLRESGYVRLEAGPAVALLDLAPIGPDYLPGHAHADTLSFEWSLFGQRVIVNGGTSRYGSGPERLAERGTAAHSTVQIDGADSSEVWGGFRVARRARPVEVRVESGETDGLVSAAHDGYRRLPGRPLHRRTWQIGLDRLTVTDRIVGDCNTAIARFHLHPEVQAEPGRLRLPDGALIDWRVWGGEVRLVADHWHPQFGLSVPSRCLEVTLTGRECRLELVWT